jgi:hypothetical protein
VVYPPLEIPLFEISLLDLKELKKMSTTNLGQFLYSTRVKRGYDSISEYLRNYTDMPISDSYYRDLETGRKIVRLDTAETLCQSLKINKKDFFYHLLLDILPTDVAEDLLKQIPDETFKSPSDEFSKKEQEISTLREAFEKRLVEEPYIVGSDVLEYLNDNFEVLPLIHFIYIKNKCTFEDLEKIMEKNHILEPLTQIIKDFEIYKITSINWDDKTVARYSKIFRIPRTVFGIKFKDKFLESEIEQTLKMPNREPKIGHSSNFVYSSVSAFKGEDGIAKISDKISGLIAQIEVEESHDNDAFPYFIAIVFSERENYTC